MKAPADKVRQKGVVNDVSENLNTKHQKFVGEWLKDFNGARAARAIGSTKTSATATASLLLTHPNVQRILNERLTKLLEKSDITVEWVLERCKRIADASILDYIDFREDDETGKVTFDLKDLSQLPRDLSYPIKSIAHSRYGIKIELESREAVLDKLAKFLKMFADTDDSASRRDVVINVNVHPTRGGDVDENARELTGERLLECARSKPIVPQTVE